MSNPFVEHFVKHRMQSPQLKCNFRFGFHYRDRNILFTLHKYLPDPIWRNCHISASSTSNICRIIIFWFWYVYFYWKLIQFHVSWIMFMKHSQIKENMRWRVTRVSRHITCHNANYMLCCGVFGLWKALISEVQKLFKFSDSLYFIGILKNRDRLTGRNQETNKDEHQDRWLNGNTIFCSSSGSLFDYHM